MKITDPAAPALQGQDPQALAERLRDAIARAAVTPGFGNNMALWQELSTTALQAADALAREHLRRQRAEEALRGLVDASPTLVVRAVRTPLDGVGLEDWTEAMQAARTLLALSNNQPEEPKP